MAWTGTEGFESYAINDNIAGKSGGSGWSGNWGDPGSTYGTVKATPSGGEGSNALYFTGSWVERAVSVSSGEVSFMMQCSAVSGNDIVGSYIGDAGGIAKIIIRAGVVSGVIDSYNSTTSQYEQVSTLAADTWYTIKIKFGHVANKFAVSINGGAYGADKGTNGNFTTITRFSLWDTATNNRGYFDDIKNGAAAEPSVSPSIISDLIIYN